MLKLKAGSTWPLERRVQVSEILNPIVTNRLSHPYQMDESTSILGASGVIFHWAHWPNG